MMIFNVVLCCVTFGEGEAQAKNETEIYNVLPLIAGFVLQQKNTLK